MRRGTRKAAARKAGTRRSATRTVPLRVAPAREEIAVGASEDMFAGAEERDLDAVPPGDDDLDR